MSRRRILRALVTIVVAALFVAVTASILRQATRELALPLSDASIIREQAAEKRLDPALIAAVIYAETKFDPRPSSTGAQGLMQVMPSTAYYLAHLSGGVDFNASDLSNPSVNVAYGSYYLRYLLDRYDGNEMLAVAAYNGGQSNVDEWVAHASAEGRRLSVDEIPFPQTREYVQRVLGAQRAYRATYARQLGLE
jgi:soluble lytic murein transglycosylase